MSETAIAERKPGIIPIIDTAEQENNLRQGVASLVQEAGIADFKAGHAVPIIDSKPLTDTTSQMAGATNVGSEKFTLEEEMNSKGRFLGRLWRTITKLFVGGNDTLHGVPGKIADKLFKGKSKKEVPNKYDPKEIQDLE